MENTIKMDNGCIQWSKFTDKNGYGHTYMNGKNAWAHRVSYILHVGDIPPKMCVCHTCDNPPCVNPDHLFLATNGDNIRDAKRKGRTAKGGDRHATAKLTEDDVQMIWCLIDGGFSQRKISKAFKVSQRAIGYILNGKNWGHIKPIHSTPLTAKYQARIEAMEKVIEAARVLTKTTYLDEGIMTALAALDSLSEREKEGL